MRKLTTLAALLAIMLQVSSCRTKDKPPVVPVTGNGTVKIEVFNTVGNSALKLDGTWYISPNNDSFQVSKFNYYVSNVKLTGAAAYAEDSSYHLIRQNDLTTTVFDLANVPYGTYTGVTFMVGIDSAHNVTGQPGVLDPINDMFWSWTTGYVMLKFEGKSPQSPNANGAFTLHAGGFSGQYNVLKTITLTFPSPITVTANGENHVHVSADLLKMLSTPVVIDFATFNTVHMPGADAKKFADNYANMFTCPYAGL